MVTEKKVRVKMPVSQRAKQFMPFAAVAGLDEIMKKKEIEVEKEFAGKNEKFQESI